MTQIIYGTTIDKLTEYVLSDVSEMSRTWPDTRAIILVPENRKLATERRYLERSERGGLMLAEVLSFSRLAFRIFDLAGLAQEERLSREAQAMLLSALIEEHKDELKLFHRLALRSGYVEKILSVISYLRRYHISPEMLLFAANATLDTSLQAKFHDIALLSQYYDEALIKLNRSDSERGLEACALLLESIVEGSAPVHIKKRLAILNTAWVWVSGYGEVRSFTPLEFRILESLEKIVSEMRITVLTDTLIDQAAQAESVKPSYVIGSQTALGIRQRMRVQNTRFVPDMREYVQALAKVMDYQSDEDLIKLVDLKQRMRDRIEIRQSSDLIAEVSHVAGQIRMLTLDGRYRYKDIAICLSDTSTYLPYLKTILPTYGIPAFIDQRRSLADTPIMRFILPLLDLAKTNWQQDHLLAVLRSGVIEMSPDQVDQLENFWLMSGLQYSSIFYLERYPNDLAEIVREKLYPLRAALQDLKRQKTCRGLIRQFRQLLSMPEVDLMIWVSSEVERLASSPADDYAVSLAKAWNSLGQILTDLETLFDNKTFTIDSLRQVIQVAAESNFSGIIPSDLDQVTVGSAHQLLGDNQKVLFILGANESSFPANGSDTGLLKDSDCDYLASVHDLNLPGLNAFQAEEDSFIVRQLLMLASDKLFISYSGMQEQMAAVVDRLRLSFDIPIEEITPTIERVDDVRLTSPQILKRQLILNMATYSHLTKTWIDLGLAADDRLDFIRLKSQYDMPTPDQDDLARLTREILGRMPNISVSALETYAACPYEYLSKYLLRVADREVYEPSSMNRGSLLHAVFEKLFHELSDDLAKAVLKGETEAVWEAYLSRDPRLESERLYEAALAEDPSFTVFEAKGQRYAAGRPVKKVIEVAWPYLMEQLRDSHYQPYSFEHSFGGHKPIPELQFRVDDELILSLRGVIDRVDIRTLENGRVGYRVIDYKSSEHKIHYDELYDGLDLQILTYLEAVRASGLDGIERNRLIAEDAMYLKLDESHQSLNEAPHNYQEALDQAMSKYFKPAQFDRTAEELELLMQMNHDNWTRLTQSIVDGEFEITPKVSGQSKLPCEFCEHRQSCSIEKESQRFQRLPGLRALEIGEAEKHNAETLLEHLREKYGRDA